MLVAVSLRNWMSFRDPVMFSMLTTREKQHLDRVPRLKKYRKRILPIATIYGGNGAGKTSFFKALSFAQSLVINLPQVGTKIPVAPYKFDKSRVEPCEFEFTVSCDEFIYVYAFHVTSTKVVYEKLTQILTTRERVLFERHENNYKFDKKLPEDDYLNFASRGTRANQLFLTFAVNLGVDWCKPVFDWFASKLLLIAPDDRFGPYSVMPGGGQGVFPESMGELLDQMDSGIANLKLEEVPFDTVQIDPKSREYLKNSLESINRSVLFSDKNKEYYLLGTDDKGEATARKVVSYHRSLDAAGSLIPLDFREESDGTRRIVELLPNFIALMDAGNDRVLVVDEIDRSLHSLVTRALIQNFLMKCSEDSRSQLLLTTHDLLLMDQKLLRRDEMWFAERDAEGVSTLFAVSDFEKLRADKDLRRNYLQGRIGGIPHVVLNNYSNLW